MSLVPDSNKHLLIVGMDAARAEQKIIALGLRYIEGAGSLSHFKVLSREDAEALYAKWRETNQSIITAFQKVRPSTLAAEEALRNLGVQLKSHPIPREDKNIRQSAKTGATWPKPKGGY